MFCYLVAPGQEKEMKNRLNKESDAIVTQLKEDFDSCNSRNARRAVLMLVPSMYCIVNRRYATYLAVLLTKSKKREIFQNFTVLDFLFSTSLLQEVAYGTTKLKLDSGDKITVANAILNGIHEHAVKVYTMHCKEIKCKPLGRSTLLKILDKMKPHTRKKLSGVDSIVLKG